MSAGNGQGRSFYAPEYSRQIAREERLFGLMMIAWEVPMHERDNPENPMVKMARRAATRIAVDELHAAY